MAEKHEDPKWRACFYAGNAYRTRGDVDEVEAQLNHEGFGVYPNQAFRRVDGTVQPAAEALFWSLRETLRDGMKPEAWAKAVTDANLGEVLERLQGRGFRIVPVEGSDG